MLLLLALVAVVDTAANGESIGFGAEVSANAAEVVEVAVFEEESSLLVQMLLLLPTFLPPEGAAAVAPMLSTGKE